MRTMRRVIRYNRNLVGGEFVGPHFFDDQWDTETRLHFDTIPQIRIEVQPLLPKSKKWLDDFITNPRAKRQ